MKAARFEDLPISRTCNQCNEEKPREQMMITRTSGTYYFRPKCKDCHNAKERGHRREYKRRYSKRWRRENSDLVKSYWDNDEAREAARVRAEKRNRSMRDAIAIQRRMNKRGMGITIAEAKELLETYGPAYPTRFGLTISGLRECERIRSRLRVRDVDHRRRQTPFEIRMMVYEEAVNGDKRFMIPPDQQQRPYSYAAERLRQYHRNKRIEEAV